MKNFKTIAAASAVFFLAAGLAMSVEPNTRAFTAGHKDKIRGVIVSRDGDTLKVRADDDSIGIVNLTDETKIQLKEGIFWERREMKTESLVPGLQIEAVGKGGENGGLVAAKVLFDPNSMRVSRQVDARVDPVDVVRAFGQRREAQFGLGDFWWSGWVGPH